MNHFMQTSFCKIITLFTIIHFLVLPPVIFAKGRSSFGTVRVRGYTKRDGTYVQPHLRSSKDGNFNNNWSTKGNYNPYTGEPGYKAYPGPTGFSYSIPSLPVLKQVPIIKIDGISLPAKNTNTEKEDSLFLKTQTETSKFKETLPVPNWAVWNEKEDPVAFLKKCSVRNATLTEAKDSNEVPKSVVSRTLAENNIASSSQLSILTEEKIFEIKEKLLKNKNHRSK